MNGLSDVVTSVHETDRMRFRECQSDEDVRTWFDLWHTDYLWISHKSVIVYQRQRTGMFSLRFGHPIFQMNQEIKERCAIKYLFKEGCFGEEIHTRLKTLYDAPCHAKRTIFSWMQRVQLRQTVLVDSARYAHTPLDCKRTISCWMTEAKWIIQSHIFHHSHHAKTPSRTPSQRRYTSTKCC
jgi:hypothetical protein